MEIPAALAKIMIVDDTFLMRQRLKSILIRAGYEVVEASDAFGAMDFLKQGIKVDLLILDLQMPGMDGLSFCRVLKAYAPTQNLPVLICSGVSSAGVVRRSVRCGAAGFLIKPFPHHTVEEHVRRILVRTLEEKDGGQPVGRKQNAKRNLRKNGRKSSPSRKTA